MDKPLTRFIKDVKKPQLRGLVVYCIANILYEAHLKLGALKHKLETLPTFIFGLKNIHHN